jgi:uncharacterized protein
MKLNATLTGVALALLSTAAQSQAALLITGVIDGPRTGGLPKGIELFATTAIADLSLYGLRSTNLAEGTGGGPELVLPSITVAAGDYYYVSSEAPGFLAYFGFASDVVDAAVGNINGDDAVVLYLSGVVVDVYGDPTIDGTGQSWDHLDSFAYRKDGTGPSTVFDVSDWVVNPINTLDIQGTAGVNGDDGVTVPFGTYSVPEPGAALLGGLGFLGLLRRRR